jgi:amidase
LKADGAHDIHTQLSLSGEPLIPGLVKNFQLKDPMNLLKYQDLTLEGRDYSAAYSDYWNATADDEAGQYRYPSVLYELLLNPFELQDQIVDVVIMPAAPHAAVIPGKYYHTGRSLSHRFTSACI